MNHIERLRRLAINDDHLAKDLIGKAEVEEMDPKTCALIRLAALVAVSGAGASYGALADAAIDAGANPAEIVDVLIGVVPIVGLPCVVAAAPNVAMALGYDIDEEFAQ
jgi:4-carboxymuconolactone decarboxylase